MPNIKVTRAEFESYWVNRRRRKRRLDTLQNLLFGHGENGFLFGNFAELDELFTTSVGPTAVAANDDPVGLALDDSAWGGRALAQVVAAATELRGNGVIGLVGAATAATYSSSTGVGSVSRVDVGNQSNVSFPIAAGATYLVDITVSNGVFLRGTATGAVVATPSNGARQQLYVNTGTTGLFITAANNGTTATFTLHALKLIPGNHALQATAANRPLWKANAGKPYLLFDGTNDNLGTSYIPNASGTVAVAFRSEVSGVLQLALGGGNATGDKRCRMGVASDGRAIFIFNGGAGGADVLVSGNRTNLDTVMAMTWSPAGRELYLNGTLVLADTLAALFDGTGSGFRIGSGEGSADVLNGRNYAALARSVRSSPAEIARITADFQRTF